MVFINQIQSVSVSFGRSHYILKHNSEISNPSRVLQISNFLMSFSDLLLFVLLSNTKQTHAHSDLWYRLGSGRSTTVSVIYN